MFTPLNNDSESSATPSSEYGNEAEALAHLNRRLFKIIVSGTLKGGVGKTNVLFNLAGLTAEELLRELFQEAGLSPKEQDSLLLAAANGDTGQIDKLLTNASEKPYRVLIIDADPQFNLTNNVGMDVRTPDLKTTQNIFETSDRAAELIYPGAIKGLPNLDVIPASLFMTKTEINLFNRTGREQIFNNFINENIQFLNKYYRYIFIDTNPNLYVINQNFFLAADHILLVSDTSYNSISGAEFFMALWSELKKPLRKADNCSAIIVNNYDTRPNDRSKEFLEYCTDPKNEEIVKYMVKEFIPINARLADTETAHMTINILPTSDSGKKESKEKALASYRNVISELKERGVL